MCRRYLTVLSLKETEAHTRSKGFFTFSAFFEGVKVENY
jgi:hypothetical protein